MQHLFSLMALNVSFSSIMRKMLEWNYLVRKYTIDDQSPLPRQRQYEAGFSDIASPAMTLSSRGTVPQVAQAYIPVMRGAREPRDLATCFQAEVSLHPRRIETSSRSTARVSGQMSKVPKSSWRSS